MTKQISFLTSLILLAAVTVTLSTQSLSVINWPLLIGASVVMALTPGANQLLSLANGFRVGVVPAMTAACG
ncbi:hypothetical protein [Salinicola sp. MH3R3-1]|uniref:hypothetical protein n=1 Tax=Salinicola sp. MH3R3-1 TaxID=1928762 RepID=UPI0009FAB3AA|nr:hypothetical protein [Salinicola sp. MH3R3-1]